MHEAPTSIAALLDWRITTTLDSPAIFHKHTLRANEILAAVVDRLYSGGSGLFTELRFSSLQGPTDATPPLHAVGRTPCGKRLATRSLPHARDIVRLASLIPGQQRCLLVGRRRNRE